MGSGGVGGYYGGLLARAGHDVTFLARGAHMEALRAGGLKVHSVHGDFSLSPVRATDDPKGVGSADLVLVCVKTGDTNQAARSIKPIVGPDTTVMSLQNGIDAADRIAAVLGRQHVMAGVTWISSAIAAPGVIRQVSQFRRIVLGEMDGRTTPRLQAIFEALKGTGVTVEISDDILKVLWTKFVFIAAISGVGTLTRLEVGDYRAVPETRALLATMMHEVEGVARAGGVMLDADIVEQTLAFTDNLAPSIKPSMQLDVGAGRPSELDSMIGVIARKGRDRGVSTPVADMVYAALLPGERKARQDP